MLGEMGFFYDHGIILEINYLYNAYNIYIPMQLFNIVV